MRSSWLLAPLAPLALLLGGSPALAADAAARAIPADAAIVATARPLAILGVASRIGSGWDKLVRRQLPIPPAVNPFDPALLSTIGIDPAATAWASLRALRGHLHVRGVLTLADRRLDEAVVRSGAAVAGIKLEHTPAGAWIGRDDDEVVVVRLDGNLLVVDALLRTGTAPLPSAAELQRLAPLTPPRAFDATRGTAQRLGPADAIAVWADLAALAPLGLLSAEARLGQTLKRAAPEIRAKLERVGRAELATCRAAIKTVPATFDDALLAVVVVGPDAVKLELALGGKAAALAALRGSKPVRASRALLPAEVDADLRITLADAGPLRAAMRPNAGTGKIVPNECPGPTSAALALRAWPALLGRLTATAADRKDRDLAWLRLLAGLRGVAIWVPGAPAPAAQAVEAMGPGEVLALAEIDDTVRGDLDRVLVGAFGAATPLRAGGRQLTAYAPPSFPWSSGEGPIVAVDPIVDVGNRNAVGGAIVGFGPRDRLKAGFERVSETPASAAAPDALLRLGAGPRAFARLLRQLEQRGAHDEALIDGLGQVDAALVLDDDALRVDLDVALRPASAGR